MITPEIKQQIEESLKRVARASRAGGRNCRKRVVIRRERDRLIQLFDHTPRPARPDDKQEIERRAQSLARSLYLSRQALRRAKEIDAARRNADEANS
ncbi:hypothetical protein ACRQD2_08750 [Actinotignum sp. GS-2025e]|uniref:hypothetical protein n=1 Tax=Actinotignum TaxID=1653174 RepID=UPI002549CF64|nr:hypothetical protein [Actinotignum timonense]MDK8283145.1 hypothetical protein [Actinotignum timonense]